jgi:hypothetical protein
MTELNLETVVLQDVVAVTGNATVLVRMASQKAGAEPRTDLPSVKSFLPSSAVSPESDDGPRYDAKYGGTPVPRAGRLADLVGGSVTRLASEHPAFGPKRQASMRICPQGLPRIGPDATGVLAGWHQPARGLQALLRGR